MGAGALKATAECQDGYEAQKLAGLVYGAGQKTYVERILNVVGSEVVMGATDMSAHSVTMRDGREAESLAGFLQSVIDGEHRVDEAKVSGARVVISKS